MRAVTTVGKNNRLRYSDLLNWDHGPVISHGWDFLLIYLPFNYHKPDFELGYVDLYFFFFSISGHSCDFHVSHAVQQVSFGRAHLQVQGGIIKLRRDQDDFLKWKTGKYSSIIILFRGHAIRMTAIFGPYLTPIWTQNNIIINEYYEVTVTECILPTAFILHRPSMSNSTKGASI